MRASGFGRYALSAFVAVAILAGCGAQSQVTTPDAMPQTSALAMHADSGKSWMLPEAKNEDLIYAAGDGTQSYVISYRSGALVGTIDTWAQSACSDSEGDVYLAAPSNVLEYAHGGTVPIETFNLPGTDPETVDCAVDPTSGNIAVTFFASSKESVAIFPSGGGNPAVYYPDFDSQFCGYDSSGDLFVDGFGAHGAPELGELPSGGSTFSDI
ncbi:MAG: hypothetical protein ABSD52_14435, partial [Candidatus Cybelea sp.]